MKISKNRLYNQHDWNQGNAQAEFRRGFFTVDHIHIVNEIIAKTKAYRFKSNFKKTSCSSTSS